MHPTLVLPLLFFASQWIINAVQNHYFYNDFPTYRRNHNVLPEIVIDKLGPSFTMLLSFGLLSIILIFFIDMGIHGFYVWIGGTILGLINLSEYYKRLRIEKKIREDSDG